MSKRNSDFSRWGLSIKKLNSSAEFLFIKKFTDGVYVIPSGVGSIDILIRGFSGESTFLRGENKKDYCVVCFNGALTTQVASCSPPYFSGLGISANSNLPIISISDPTLYLSSGLKLAWYAGNCHERNLQVVLSSIISHVCLVHGLCPIFLGGSGGGFSALVQALLFKYQSFALVWNPQTAIENYQNEAVMDFLENAFPDEYKNNVFSEGSSNNYEVFSRLSRTGVLHNLCDVDFPAKSKVIYLQNKNDWHVALHAKPYLSKKKILRLGNANFVSGENVFFHFGDWGACHEGPPSKFIEDLLIDISKNHSIDYIFSRIDSSSDCYSLFLADLEDGWSPCFEVTEGVDQTFISVLCGLKKLKGVRYAIYWFSEKKKNVIWYQSDSFFSIPLGLDRLDALQIFMKDSWGDVKSFYIDRGKIINSIKK